LIVDNAYVSCLRVAVRAVSDTLNRVTAIGVEEAEGATQAGCVTAGLTVRQQLLAVKAGVGSGVIVVAAEAVSMASRESCESVVTIADTRTAR
jgi:hypothetical protein